MDDKQFTEKELLRSIDQSEASLISLKENIIKNIFPILESKVCCEDDCGYRKALKPYVDCISRQEAIDLMFKLDEQGKLNVLEIRDGLEALEMKRPKSPNTVEKLKWIPIEYCVEYESDGQCPSCKEKIVAGCTYNFCPNCGHPMEVDEKYK